jgi:hypothetical protein
MITFDENIMEKLVVIIGERGYAGKNKAQIRQSYDLMFGEDHWSKGHLVDTEVVSTDVLMKYYEDGYFHFLQQNSDVLEWLVNTASDVYDIDPSNVNSRLDYNIQECNATHLQDISVRRVLQRLGKKFAGDHLVQIRGHESEGYVLNPGRVPFHQPELILHSDNKGNWWEPDSIEAFYQHNKVLLVDPGKLVVTPEIECPDGKLIYSRDKSTSYKPLEDPHFLQAIKGKVVRRMAHEQEEYKFLRNQETKSYSTFMNDARILAHVGGTEDAVVLEFPCK